MAAFALVAAPGYKRRQGWQNEALLHVKEFESHDCYRLLTLTKCYL
jgi:hypothetical protein